MNTREWSAFLLLGLIWGASFMLIKIGLEAMQTVTLVAVRVFLGTLALWIVVWWRRLPVPTAAGVIGALTFMGLFNSAVPFSLITWGETTIASGLAAVLNSTTPLFTVVIAHVWLQDERISVPKMIGLLVGFVGVIVVIRGGSEELSFAALRSGDLGGQIAVILASASYAITAVFARRYLRGIHPFVAAAGQLTASSVFMTGAVFAFEWPVSVRLTAGPLLAVITLGIVNTGIAYVLYFFLISEAGATQTSLVTYVIPVVGLMLGFVFLDEPLSLAIILGFLLIVVGILLINRRRPRSEPAPVTSLTTSESTSAAD